jgi:hypothetical protein
MKSDTSKNEPPEPVEPPELAQTYMVLHRQVGSRLAGSEFVGRELYPGEDPAVAVRQLNALLGLGAIAPIDSPEAQNVQRVEETPDGIVNDPPKIQASVPPSNLPPLGASKPVKSTVKPDPAEKKAE